MEVKDLVKHGNILRATFDISDDNYDKLSPLYEISASVNFQVKGTTAWYYSNNAFKCISVLIKFGKITEEDKITYVLKLSSEKFGLIDKCLTTYNTWHVVYDANHKSLKTFDISVQVDIVPPTTRPFSILHEDTDLIDFQLKGEDGYVSVHKIILAGISPVFKKMFTGNWKEATEGKVNVPGTSLATLQHLKDYIYSNVVPDDGLEQLIVLASCYMITDLEEKCAVKLGNTLTAETTVDLLKLASIHNIISLQWQIIDCISKNTIDVLKIKQTLIKLPLETDTELSQ